MVRIQLRFARSVCVFVAASDESSVTSSLSLAIPRHFVLRPKIERIHGTARTLCSVLSQGPPPRHLTHPPSSGSIVPLINAWRWCLVPWFLRPNALVILLSPLPFASRCTRPDRSHLRLRLAPCPLVLFLEAVNVGSRATARHKTRHSSAWPPHLRAVLEFTQFVRSRIFSTLTCHTDRGNCT
jgi:hypothetical protein